MVQQHPAKVERVVSECVQGGGGECGEGGVRRSEYGERAATFEDLSDAVISQSQSRGEGVQSQLGSHTRNVETLRASYANETRGRECK